MQMRRNYKFEIIVTSREARGSRIPQCNAGADAAQVQI